MKFISGLALGLSIWLLAATLSGHRGDAKTVKPLGHETCVTIPRPAHSDDSDRFYYVGRITDAGEGRMSEVYSTTEIERISELVGKWKSP